MNLNLKEINEPVAENFCRKLNVHFASIGTEIINNEEILFINHLLEVNDDETYDIYTKFNANGVAYTNIESIMTSPISYYAKNYNFETDNKIIDNFEKHKPFLDKLMQDSINEYKDEINLYENVKTMEKVKK